MKNKFPVRTCIACRESKPKKELIRIVRTPDNRVIVDPGGKTGGRGAYLCPKIECFDEMKKKKRLARELKIEIDDVSMNELEKAFKDMIS